MSTTFALVFEEARGDISLSRLAQTMAGPKAKSARGPVGNLSRLQKGNQEPSKSKVEQIAKALASIRGLSNQEFKYWQSRLMSAAGYGGVSNAAKLDVSESEERGRLYPACHKALHTVPQLKEHEIQTILDHIGVSTMKLIIAAVERGEEIEVVQLQKISAELQQTAQRSLGAIMVADAGDPSTVINAGRAKIMIDGDVTPAQLQVLKNAAEMIESVLDL